MPKIKTLPSQLVDQIAAGEVVERPVSVVKELVENALDAGSDSVWVEVGEGGKERMVVRDNGEGLEPADAEMAFKRFATSKIGSMDDLLRLGTYGFRGEALSSIAAVAKVTLQTKTADQVEGTKVKLAGGEMVDTGVCAHPVGTTIEVTDLFYNVPARQKFLKSTRTEFKHIREWLEAQSLVCPQVGFSLKHNGKLVFDYPPGQTRRQRVETVLEEDPDRFVEVDAEAEYVRVEGFCGIPRLARKRQSHEYLFVNGRFLSNRTVVGALRKAYEKLLPARLYPPFVLYLTVREDLLDVNVHPRKEEVKFVSPSVVFDLVFNAVRSALSGRLEEAGGGFRLPVRAKDEFSVGGMPERSVTGVSSQGTAVTPRSPSREVKVDQMRSFLPEAVAEGDDDWLEESYTVPVWQIAELYLVVPQEDGLLVYDQHAAEERIFLEEFVEGFKAEMARGAAQELLFPIVINLSAEGRTAVQERREVLQKVGFRYEINDEGVNLEAVPAILKERDLEGIFLEFVDDLLAEEFSTSEEEADAVGLDHQTYQDLVYLACRSAVKQGDTLSPSRRRRLIHRLKELGERGATCPHGRPTWLKISLKDLAREFKRE